MELTQRKNAAVHGDRNDDQGRKPLQREYVSKTETERGGTEGTHGTESGNRNRKGPEKFNNERKAVFADPTDKTIPTLMSPS